MLRRRKRKVYGIFICLIAGIFAISGLVLGNSVYFIQEDPKSLCRIYADVDHELEIAPQRYNELGAEKVNSFDWYKSCINHTKSAILKGIYWNGVDPIPSVGNTLRSIVSNTATATEVIIGI